MALPERIAAYAARQGGFSAVQLPGAVDVRPELAYLIRPSRSGDDWLLEVPTSDNMALAIEGNLEPVTFPATISLETSGGPYLSAPFVQSEFANLDNRFISLIRLAASGLPAPPLEQLTIEGYLRQQVGAGAPGPRNIQNLIQVRSPTIPGMRIELIQQSGQSGSSYSQLRATFPAPAGGSSRPEILAEIGTEATAETWRHCALSVGDDGAALFVNGVRVGEIGGTALSGINWEAMTRMVYTVVAESANEPLPTLLSCTAGGHMIRYTPRARYTGNFTPPQI
jgi:hypothetical protein